MTLQACVGPLDHHQGISCTSSSRTDEVYNMSYVKITSNIYYLKNCFYFDFVSSTTTTTTTTTTELQMRIAYNRKISSPYWLYRELY